MTAAASDAQRLLSLDAEIVAVGECLLDCNATIARLDSEAAAMIRKLTALAEERRALRAGPSLLAEDTAEDLPPQHVRGRR